MDSEAGVRSKLHRLAVASRGAGAIWDKPNLDAPAANEASLNLKRTIPFVRSKTVTARLARLAPGRAGGELRDHTQQLRLLSQQRGLRPCTAFGRQKRRNNRGRERLRLA